MRSPLNAILLVAALTLIVFTFTRHRVGANVLSRLITVERLVDAGTFAHDDTQFTESADSVMIDGKRYSSKQPTFTLVLAALAWPVSALTGAAVYTHQRAYLHWLVLCHQVLPYIVLLWFGARCVCHVPPLAPAFCAKAALEDRGAAAERDARKRRDYGERGFAEDVPSDLGRLGQSDAQLASK
ncbi:MAG: hypothetical protein AAFX94_06390, partial [Myxococcota bacterium]